MSSTDELQLFFSLDQLMSRKGLKVGQGMLDFVEGFCVGITTITSSMSLTYLLRVKLELRPTREPSINA